LDEISDFGRMKNDILDSMFVQSLNMSCLSTENFCLLFD